MLSNFNVTAFQQRMKSHAGPALGNRFQVELPSFSGASTEDLTFFCKTTNLPGQQVLTQERIIGITNQKVAYGYANDDVSMSFIMTNDYFIKNYFTNWQDLCIVKEQGTAHHYPNYKTEYVRDVKIMQLDKNSNITYTCDLIDAFPTTVNAIQLGDDSGNAILELTVELSYTRWYGNASGARGRKWSRSRQGRTSEQ